MSFGSEPAYIRTAKLLPQLADDCYPRIEAMDSEPVGVPVIGKALDILIQGSPAQVRTSLRVLRLYDPALLKRDSCWIAF